MLIAMMESDVAKKGHTDNMVDVMKTMKTCIDLALILFQMSAKKVHTVTKNRLKRAKKVPESVGHPIQRSSRPWSSPL